MTVVTESTTRTSQNAINNTVFRGRKPILTNQTVFDKASIPEIINTALKTHVENVTQIKVLEDYYLGQQQIQGRVKEQRPDIDNKITVNNAYAITRILNGIAYGNQIQVVARKKGITEEIEKFNEFSLNESKHKKDMEVSNWQSICGTAYVLTLPNIAYIDKENKKLTAVNPAIPFKSYVLNPKTSFCVYSNTIDKKRVLGVTYQINYDDQNAEISRTYTIYTEDMTYTYLCKGSDGTINKEEFLEDAREVPRLYSKKVPMVECPNDQFSQGDWEMTLPLMDSINLLTSDRLNQFVQNVCYIYKMINCEFDDGITDIWDVINKGYVQVKTGGDPVTKADFDIMSVPVDQNSIQSLADYLQDKLELIIGIPNRQSREGGGGDTGSAVFLRNGLDDTHTRIAIKHAFRIASEMEISELKLDITNQLGLTKLSPQDIDIKITPVRHDNSQQTAQALQIYDTIGYPKEDSLSLLNLTQDPTSLAVKWQISQDESAKKKQALVNKQPDNQQSNDNITTK